MVDATIAEKLAALLMYDRGEPFLFSKRLLDTMKPTRLELEELEDGQLIKLTIMSNEVLIQPVDKPSEA